MMKTRKRNLVSLGLASILLFAALASFGCAERKTRTWAQFSTPIKPVPVASPKDGSNTSSRLDEDDSSSSTASLGRLH